MNYGVMKVMMIMSLGNDPQLEQSNVVGCLHDQRIIGYLIYFLKENKSNVQ